MEMTFTQPANHRQLTFEEIAKSAKITVNKVELLVMKARSMGLSRVLDLQQAKGVKDHLELWCTDVKSMEMLVEHQAQDILTNSQTMQTLPHIARHFSGP
ncbi:26S proteasome non-ATPase regulatory subunit 13 [Sigmodon hispidus]